MDRSSPNLPSPSHDTSAKYTRVQVTETVTTSRNMEVIIGDQGRAGQGRGCCYNFVRWMIKNPCTSLGCFLGIATITGGGAVGAYYGISSLIGGVGVGMLLDRNITSTSATPKLTTPGRASSYRYAACGDFSNGTIQYYCCDDFVRHYHNNAVKENPPLWINENLRRPAGSISAYQCLQTADSCTTASQVLDVTKLVTELGFSEGPLVNGTMSSYCADQGAGPAVFKVL